MNKTILIVTGGLGSGGLERITTNIANIYASKGWVVIISCLLDETGTSFYHLDESIQLSFYYQSKYYVKKNRHFSKIVKWIKYLKSLKKQFNPDVVLAMTLRICSLCILSLKTNNNRIVLREISDPKSKARSKVSNFINFIICSRVSSVIFQTNWEKECYPKYLQKKGYVIPNPISVSCVVRFCSLRTHL